MSKPKLCVINFNGVVPDLSDWFEIMPLENLKECSALLTWNEVVSDSRLAVQIAKQMDIPSFVIQHGVNWGPSTTEVKMHNHQTMGCHYFVWSENSKKKYMGEGIPEENITVSGSSLWSQWSKTNFPQGKRVIYAPMHSVLKHNDTVQKEGVDIWEALNGIDGIDPVAKILMGEHKRSLYPGNVVMTNRFNDFHIYNTFESLNTADLVVIQEEGTFALMAYSLDLPVIKISNSFPFCTNAPVKSTIAELPEKVNYMLENRDFNKQERINAVLENGGDPMNDQFKNIVTDKIMESIR